MTLPTFTAHNIRFANGEETMPGQPLWSDCGIAQAALRTIDMVTPGRSVRVVDLGALEGGYAVAFARAGHDVTSVEVRALNMVKCRYVAERVHLPNLRFVHDTAWNVLDYGLFDVVFCSGLLYHLDRPVEFLRLLGRATTRAVIIQTHFSVTPISINEGAEGHWYSEDNSEESVWSSYENSRSFWLTKPHLLQAIHDAGFDVVFEQYDFLSHMVNDPYIEAQRRSMFVGIKS